MNTQHTQNPSTPSTEPVTDENEAKLAPDTKELKEKFDRSTASAKERGARLADTAKEKYQEMKTATARSLHEGAEQARYRAKDFSSKMRSDYGERSVQLQESFNRHPLAYTAGAFAVGFLVGLAIPKSRHEDRFVGEQRERLQRKGAELKNQAKEATQEAVQSAKRTFEQKVQGEEI